MLTQRDHQKTYPWRYFVLFVACALVAAGCAGDTGSSATTAGEGDDAACTDFPTREVELVVPYSSGGGYDRMARLIAPFVQAELGDSQPVVVTNIEGGGGLVGTEAVFAAEPDGYQIIYTDLTNTGTGELLEDVTFATTEFTPIARLEAYTEVLSVGASSGVESVEDLQAAAAEGEVVMGSAGIAIHEAIVATEVLGIEYDPILHEGSSENILSVIRGDTTVLSHAVATVVDPIRQGDLVPVLLIGDPPGEGRLGEDELAGLPIIDDILQQPGIGVALQQNRVVLAPPDMPRCLQERIADAFLAALDNPEFSEAASAAEVQSSPLGPDETGELIENSVELYATYLDLLTSLDQ